jgi:hypothetical protein
MPSSARMVPRSRQTDDVGSAERDDRALVDDDGRTLWASPTAGKPLDISHLPPGVQIIVAVRPEAIAAHPEGEKVLAALGPLGERGLQLLAQAVPSPRGVERCIIGCQANSQGRWQTTLVVQLSDVETAQSYVEKRLPGATEKRNGENRYFLANDLAYYTPPGDNQHLLVVAQPGSIVEIIDLGGSPPPLRRDIERLLEHTDAERHFTVIVAPNFLFGEGQSMFAGTMAPLRGPLFWFLGDELSAAALSLHWDENFFVELIAAPTLDTRPEAAARILAERVAQVPDRLEEYVIGLDADPFSRRVVARFPTMVRKLATYSRTGVEADHAVLRCYLPAVAGHNLLMAAELTLAESARRVGATAVAAASADPPAEAGSPLSKGLQQRASLSFARDTLEAALEQLSMATGIEIEIIGPDLQAEGITKNQSFGIELADKPTEAILVEILRLANPDKTATGPGDPRQKLVYVIAPAAGEQGERILVTTRARAAERGDELPAIFRAGER